MNQFSFADIEFTSKRRKTRKELFLGRINELIPWQQLEAQIELFSPKLATVGVHILWTIGVR